MLDPKDLETCVRVLGELVSDRGLLAYASEEQRNQLLMLAGRVSRPERTEQKRLSREVRKVEKKKVKAEDRALLDQSGIRKKRLEAEFLTPGPELTRLAGGGSFVEEAGVSYGETPARAGNPKRPFIGTLGESEEPLDEAGERARLEGKLHRSRSCYICKNHCEEVHAFYDQMCGPCGDFNYKKRTQTADLRGRIALISGARVKIGYQAAILLLRAGARVIVTTRFPRDAARRYAREVDYENFRDRLQIYGLDLRHTPSVETFARHLTATESGLDFVLHNACQTVRRPAGFYGHLMENELGSLERLPAEARGLLRDYEELRRGSLQQLEGPGTDAPGLAVGIHAAAALSQVALTPEDAQLRTEIFPEGKLDQDRQQIDLRTMNSWRLPLDQVGTVELLEVQLVNAIAPFLLNARLKELMLRRQRTFDQHIVNVSAMEGQFYRRYKTDKHPHTNMAKAALNMMTRTSAPDYAKDGIFMNSVDTGWVTDEDPAQFAERKRAEIDFHPPLDIVDGAARIVDPIFDGINTGRHVWGQFLKDYRPTVW